MVSCISERLVQFKCMKPLDLIDVGNLGLYIFCVELFELLHSMLLLCLELEKLSLALVQTYPLDTQNVGLGKGSIS